MSDEGTHAEDHVMLQQLLVGQKHQDKMLAKLEQKQDDTNGRVTKLEKFQYLLTGGIIVLAIVVAPLVIRILTEG